VVDQPRLLESASHAQDENVRCPPVDVRDEPLDVARAREVACMASDDLQRRKRRPQLVSRLLGDFRLPPTRYHRCPRAAETAAMSQIHLL